RVARSLPTPASHSRAVLSRLPVTTRVPSGENATATTSLVCPWRAASDLPSFASNSSPSRAVLSRLPVTTRVPSRPTATPPTALPSEGGEVLRIARIPQPRRLVPAPGDHARPVRRERHGGYGRRVTLQHGALMYVHELANHPFDHCGRSLCWIATGPGEPLDPE